MSTPLKLCLGSACFRDPADLQAALDALKAADIQEIDTAENYYNNEADLGAAGAAQQGFVISTKNPAGWRPGSLQDVVAKTNASLERLNTNQVDILYAHAPDRTLTWDDWVPRIDTLYRQGKFRRFGVSNFSPEEVSSLHAYCRGHGFVLPTVYQGNYNAVSRAYDTTLFPLLRDLGIVFYAYSPIAGGFLTKSRRALEEGKAEGRFAEVDDSLSKTYRGFYVKPKFLEGLGRWEELAGVQGVSGAELAYRWVYYHSAIKPDLGDRVIIGASKVEQITRTVEGLRNGPLKDEVVRGIDEIWELVKEDAIVDNFEALGGSAGL